MVYCTDDMYQCIMYGMLRKKMMTEKSKGLYNMFLN